MPVFRVNLIRTVTDELSCTVDVEATNQRAAAEYALAQADALVFEYERQLDRGSTSVDAVEPAPADTLASLTAPAQGAVTTRYRLQFDRWRHPATGMPGAIASMSLYDGRGALLAVADDDNEEAAMSGVILDAVALAGEEIPAENHGHPQILPRFIAAVLLSQLGVAPGDPATLDVTCNED